MPDKTILVVEDNELHRRLLRDLLGASGYLVREAASGAAAVHAAVTEKPDLILLDGRLPDMSGLDLARALKAGRSTWNIPIIAVTAHAMPGDEQLLMDAGCNAYLSKPINVRDLLVLVETFFSRPTARRNEAEPETPPGEIIELPRPDENRWPFRQKAVVVQAVRTGALTIEDACERYRISLEEYATWQRAVEEHGVHALRATRNQLYRNAPLRKRRRENGTN